MVRIVLSAIRGGIQRRGYASTRQMSFTKLEEIPKDAVGYCERCLMGWQKENIYDVVADVSTYKEFLPWCVGSKVNSETKDIGGHVREMNAGLTVGFSVFSQDYTSAVSFEPKSTISARLSGGHDVLLDYITCEWDFTSIGDNSTEVNFEVVFKFRQPIHQKLSGLVLSQVVETMVTSFETRVRKLHGQPSHARQDLPLLYPERHTAPLLSPELTSPSAHKVMGFDLLKML
eukprot:TRINITY_DN1522_c0_g1_i1.p1 TRINITY_DN1522_c0_g1~~TRINITY_DN1522_c0_g1_i1.p1  ORF type:complete len:231 (+),score=24.29 TRINITY_DN1522_c0_g1_i1:41-733(+)